MSCQRRSLPILAAGLIVSLGVGPLASAATDTATELRFVEGLRGLGYYDLANDHLESLRTDPNAPADLKQVIDYEQGRGLLEEAARMADLERQRDHLEKARAKLTSFTQQSANHPQAPAALAQIARLYIQRGEIAKYQSEDAKTPAERDGKISEARESYAQARTTLDSAIGKLQEEFAKFPNFLEPKDPRKALKDSIHSALMQAEFQRATVEYADGHTFGPGDERKKRLDDALARFKALSDKYRTQSIGLYAKLWEGKSHEESDRLGEAMGLFNQLMEHRDPRLAELKRKVGYFRILVMRKRGEHALAADEATRWLAAYPNAATTSDGLGVMLERARNMDIQLAAGQATIPKPERDAASKVIRDTLRQVVRIYSPHKADALKLLEKYDPRGTLSAQDVAKMGYDEAMAAAESSINAGQLEDAITLLSSAIERAKADGTRGNREQKAQAVEKANRARYLLAYCDFSTQRYYQAIVLAEFLARKYPQGGLSAKAADIAIAAHVGAYNTFKDVDRTSDLARLLDFAEYAARTWSDQDAGNAARSTIGAVELGRGNYEQAIAAYDAVTPNSGRKTDAIMQAGAAHWKWSQALRAQNKTAEADAQTQAALSDLTEAYQARVAANAPIAEAGRIDNACLLAEVQLALGKGQEALGVLKPLSDALAAGTTPEALKDRRLQVLTALILANIQTGQSDQAIKDLEAVEQAGLGGDAMVRLYVKLGKLLEKEIADSKASNDVARLQKTQADYNRFLTSLIASKSGQTYESLQWAGEAKLALGEYSEAAEVFRKVIETFQNDPKLKEVDFGRDLTRKMQRTHLRLASAQRGAGQFSEARRTLEPLLGHSPPLLEAMIEDCRLLTDMAKAKQGSWDAALVAWNKLSRQLGAVKPRPSEYYDVHFEIAQALANKGEAKKAQSTITSLLRLHQRAMTPEQVARFQELQARVGGG